VAAHWRGRTELVAVHGREIAVSGAVNGTLKGARRFRRMLDFVNDYCVLQQV
jgi:hypothetical protein